MFEIVFYTDARGFSDVEQFIKDLDTKSTNDKNARVNFTKIVAYFDLLEEYGVLIGMPVTRHLDGAIWELRPISNRFLYAFYKNQSFIVLSCFEKKSQKTPRREIDKAVKRLEEYRKRNG